MAGNFLLVVGAVFVLVLAVGQLLIKRKHSTNLLLISLFTVSFLWIAHGVAFRFGLVDRLPHLNKVYLPLLCITGSLWYTYVRCLYNSCPEGYAREHFMLPMACMLLSVPFYLQSAAYKRAYIEVELSDLPSVFMYAATRLAELTLIWYFYRALQFLRTIPEKEKPNDRVGMARILWCCSLVGLIASLTRLIGSVAGSDTVSVLYPCLLAIAVYIFMHFLSYRKPVVLSLSHSSRAISTIPSGADELQALRSRIRTEQWYLAPNLKIQTLARKLEIPPGQLSSLINTVTGMNFNEFINEFRVDHAKELLLSHSEKTILDVVHDSGFNSKSAFYRHFTAITGVTPAQFRAANQQNLPTNSQPVE